MLKLISDVLKWKFIQSIILHKVDKDLKMKLNLTNAISLLAMLALSPASVLSYSCSNGFTMLCCDMLAYNNPAQTMKLSPKDTLVGGVYISYGCKLPLSWILFLVEKNI